jgi:hypothetical protein
VTDQSWITDEMRSVIGRSFGAVESYPISISDIRRWAIATYYPEQPPRIYWDEEYAQHTPHGGIVAPEEFNPFAWVTAKPGMSARKADINFDYIEESLGVRGPGLATNLNAGYSVEYGARMLPGDVIRSSSRVLSYVEKTGRMGRMLITVNRTTWWNQRDELVKQSDQTSIRY